VCRLLTAAEIASALGSTPSAGQPSGRTIDQELGARSWGCGRQVGEFYLAVDVIEFASAGGPARGLTEAQTLAKRTGPEGIELKPATGLGERALWGASEEGAIWSAIKGKYMLSVVLAGELKDPQRVREPLRRLAALGLGRLP
jgi:hypothetical protein